MKSFFAVVLFTTVVTASFLDSRSFLNNAKFESRQSSDACTNNYIGFGQSCSRSSSSTPCKGGLDCVTTNGGSAYTCQFVSPSTSCSANSDCSGLPCTSGKCVLPIALPGQSCSTNDNCVSGVCTSNTCAAGASGASCTVGTCAKGLYCYANSTGSTGTCTARIANGANCLNAVFSPDVSIACATGACQFSTTGTSAVCASVGSVSAGSSFIGDSALCSTNTYAQSNADFTTTCVSSAPSCNNENSCSSSASTHCNCPSSGTGNGTCSSLSCASQADAANKCLYSSDFGVYGSLSAIYANGQCSSDGKSVICCDAGADPNSYVPSGFCSSSAMIAPIFALIVAVIALTL